ncbi:MAG TPA: hypothetical protein VN865_02930 [Candidatus Acidoferrales bacterium]|nr:hypothetical protein [Candidatus Acidoferrales bacterium]
MAASIWLRAVDSADGAHADIAAASVIAAIAWPAIRIKAWDSVELRAWQDMSRLWQRREPIAYRKDEKQNALRRLNHSMYRDATRAVSVSLVSFALGGYGGFHARRLLAQVVQFNLIERIDCADEMRKGGHQ